MEIPRSTNVTLREVYACEDHIISQFVAVDILHSIAYAYSFYISRSVKPAQPKSLVKEVTFQGCVTDSWQK